MACPCCGRNRNFSVLQSLYRNILQYAIRPLYHFSSYGLESTPMMDLGYVVTSKIQIQMSRSGVLNVNTNYLIPFPLIILKPPYQQIFLEVGTLEQEVTIWIANRSWLFYFNSKTTNLCLITWLSLSRWYMKFTFKRFIALSKLIYNFAGWEPIQTVQITNKLRRNDCLSSAVKEITISHVLYAGRILHRPAACFSCVGV